MGSHIETVQIDVPFAVAFEAFNGATDFYVEKVLADTSSRAKGAAYAAAGLWASQSPMMAALSIGRLKGKAVHHPSKAQSVITIPSDKSYGGSMTATLMKAPEPSQCRVEISAKTQGWPSGPAKQAVAGLRDFLMERLAEFTPAKKVAKGESASLAQDLERLAALRDSGSLSEEEFVTAKARLLEGS